MNQLQKYLFDLNGYLVVPGALSESKVEALNKRVDEAGIPDLLSSTKYIHSGFPAFDTPNLNEKAGPVDLVNGLLTDWGPEFRALVDNPAVLDHLEDMLGAGLRLDHSYAIFMRANPDLSAPHHLHNGGTPFDPSQCYVYRDGKMFSSLVVVSYALSDVNSGDGGFCVIPGSHKANFAVPGEVAAIIDDSPPVVHVPVKAGDAIVFTEAVTHGSIPWVAAHDRRAVLLKYAPGFVQWEKGSPWVNFDHDWSSTQKRLLTGPYAAEREHHGDVGDGSA